MSSVKISELSSVSEVLGTDESPVVQSSTTKKFSMTQLGSYILNGFSGLSLGGVAQTAKAAIDALATALTTLSDFIGSTSMGTTATTVTGAIAEHEGDITSLDSSVKLKIKTFTASAHTVAGGGNLGLSANDFSVSAPTGYMAVGLVGYSSGIASCSCYSVNANATGTQRMMSIMNYSGSSASVTPSIVILFASSDRYSPN